MLTKQWFEQLITDMNSYTVTAIEMNRKNRKSLSQGTKVELNPRGYMGIPVLLDDLDDNVVVLTIKEDT